MTVFQDAVQSALDQPVTDDMVTRVKGLVSDELLNIDKSLQILRTNYFNHTYLPDLLVTWLDEGRRRSRPYYLRFNVLDAPVAEDARRLDVSDPAFVGLESQRPSADRPNALEGLLASLADQPQVLVTGGAAISELARRGDESGQSLAGLVPPAFVRGGRGWLDESSVDNLAEAADEAFRAASRLDAEVTSQSVATLRRYLRDEYEQEVERSLGLLWLGSGGALDEFPSGTDMSKSLMPGRLRTVLLYLLRSGPLGDDAFWERVGELVHEDELLGLGVLEPTSNLQRLMRARRRQLSFVSVAASHDDQAAQVLDEAQWRITGDDHLVLETSHVTLDFVRDGRKHNAIQSDGMPVSLSDLLARADGFLVESVALDSGTLSARFDSKGTESVTQNEWFTSLSQTSSLGGIRSATIRLPESGGRLRCDFERRVATMESSHQRPMWELGTSAAMILLPLTLHDLSTIRSALGANDPEPGTLDLA